MRVVVIPIVFRSLGTFLRFLGKKLGELMIKGRTESLKTTVL